MRSTTVNFLRAFDRDMVDRDPLDECVPFVRLNLTPHEVPCRLQKKRLVPNWNTLKH